MSTNLKDRRTALDVVTMLTVLPWVLMKPDRDLKVHVAQAMEQSRKTIDAAERLGLLRGIIHIWMGVFGQQINPDMLETVIREVVTQVDSSINDQYDDGLGGTPV